MRNDIFNITSNEQDVVIKLLPKLKKGNKIHIKKKNRSKFTQYCGGKVTDECIQRGKNSSNPVIRKRAVFADNARHFKHMLGGTLLKTDYFNEIINSIDNIDVNNEL